MSSTLTLTTIATIEAALDRRELQVLCPRHGWYDVRRNGTTKRWKRQPHRASVPVKVGLRDAFRLEIDDTCGGCGLALRVRPNTFDPRCRRA